MGKMQLFRAVVVGVVFGIIGLAPIWYRWGFLGFTLALIVVKIEQSNEHQ